MITVNSVSRSSGQPSAPQRLQNLNVDLDDDYPTDGYTGGYDVSGSLAGGTVVWSETKPHFDGGTLRWFKVNPETSKLQAFVNTGGAPGAEASDGTDLSGHVGLEVAVLTE